LTLAFYVFTVLDGYKRCRRLEAAGNCWSGHFEATLVESPDCGRKCFWLKGLAFLPKSSPFFGTI
jgi:hypothetical protein